MQVAQIFPIYQFVIYLDYKKEANKACCTTNKGYRIGKIFELVWSLLGYGSGSCYWFGEQKGIYNSEQNNIKHEI